MSKSDLVVKDNALINASYTLSLVEQRLILLAIVAARKEQPIDAKTKLLVSADNYIEQFGTHRTTAYQALKDACDNLFNRYFTYQESNEKNGGIAHMKSRWVSEIGYVDANALVKITFAPAVIPLITELENRFTQYELKQISGLSSAYAVRLYEVLVQWRSTGKVPTIELKDLRSKLGILDSEYNRIESFKRRVLDVAINQINEHTDITVKYDQHKAGRVITGFSFSFGFKKSAKTPSPKAVKPASNTAPSPNPEAEKRELHSRFLGYQQQAALLKETLEQLATKKEIKLFKQYGFMK